jgi:hypothetical protein
MTPNGFANAAQYPLTTWFGLLAEARALTEAGDVEVIHAHQRRWNKLTRVQRRQLAASEAKARQRYPLLTLHAGRGAGTALGTATTDRRAPAQPSASPVPARAFATSTQRGMRWPITTGC